VAAPAAAGVYQAVAKPLLQQTVPCRSNLGSQQQQQQFVALAAPLVLAAAGVNTAFAMTI
jgi:hypothetical protein